MTPDFPPWSGLPGIEALESLGEPLGLLAAGVGLAALVLTVLALLLFLDERYRSCAAATVALVLVKETAITTPMVFGAWLLFRDRRVKAIGIAAATASANVFGWRWGVLLGAFGFFVVELVRGRNVRRFGAPGEVATKKSSGSLPMVTYWAIGATMCS